MNRFDKAVKALDEPSLSADTRSMLHDEQWKAIHSLQSSLRTLSERVLALEQWSDEVAEAAQELLDEREPLPREELD